MFEVTVVDLAHGIADLAHGIDRVPGRGLDQADVLADFLGRLGGLSGQRLDLMRDHRKAAARLARARSLDGRVQGQKIGLFGDRLDQIEHAVDALGRRGEAFDLGDRLFGPHPRLFDGACGLADLLADLFHGGRQLVGGAGDGGHVGWRPARSRRRRRLALAVRHPTSLA